MGDQGIQARGHFALSCIVVMEFEFRGAFDELRCLCHNIIQIHNNVMWD